MQIRSMIAVAALATVSAVAHAGDAEAGKNKAMVCTSCHGADGKTTMMTSYPKLAGQNAAYLEVSMKAYRDGQRTGGQAPTMAAMIAGKSDADIADLAAYFSSL